MNLNRFTAHERMHQMSGVPLSASQRFALRLARVMLEEGRVVLPGFHDNRLGHHVVTNHPAGDENFWICVFPDGDIVYGDYHLDGEGWEPGLLDFRWPTTAHERLTVLARIDSMLAEPR